MIPGYNHNVKYKERVYHVQTEDSGLKNPHIITHLFVGGNIIHSVKTSYADIVSDERATELITELMQGQHKTMLRELIKGKLDAKIGERSAGAGQLNGPAPLNVNAGAQNRASFGFGSAGGEAAPKGPRAPTPPAPPPPPRAPSSQPPAPPAMPTSPFADIPVPGIPTPTPAAPAGASLQAQAEAGNVIEAETLQKAFDSKDESLVDSIFGEDLISEKSLDEVILTYLSDDLTE